MLAKVWTLSVFLVSWGLPAYGSTGERTVSSVDAPPTAEDVVPMPAGGAFDVSLDLGVGGVGEVFSSAEPNLGWGGGEWSAALSVQASEWSGELCFPFCGPLWTDTFGARLDLRARGLVSPGDASGTAHMDLHLEQSSEIAIWAFSVGQTFSFQRDAAFWLNFWRPHTGTMSAGVTGSMSLLSGSYEDGGVEVLVLKVDWRRLIQESPAGWEGVADEVRADIALVNGSMASGVTWYERLGIGVLVLDFYGVPIGREGNTSVTEEAMNITFDFGVLEGFRLWDAPWKIDATAGIVVMSPIAEVRRTPITTPDSTGDIIYESGPGVFSPHLWAAVHHMGDRPVRTLTQSLVFQAIPEDADFGVGAGSFQRIDSSGFAVDVGGQLALYGRVPLTSFLDIRAEAVGVLAHRSLVSSLSPELPLRPGDNFMMGRAEMGLDWALSGHWLFSTTGWVEHSDRESSAAERTALFGPTARAGARVGLYFSY